MKPVIVINMKTYHQKKWVIKIAKIIEKIDKDVIIGVQPTDIYEISKKTKLQVYSQHVDYFYPGRNTGFILPESIKENGAVGTFLNHSEHRLNFETIKKTVARCKKLKLKTLVFSKDLNEAKKIEKLKPDYIVIEPPQLIAGKISVSEAKPDLIKKTSEFLKSKFLVGAGIHSRKDIERSVELGAVGVAFSSIITTSKNPEKKIRELLK